ncbi:MAG: protein kinase [Gemmatimonadota bacterium]|nr:protein kinase [Gemmatimonadota bacterium]
MLDQLERLRTALADRYILGSELGAGGMGTVYLAEDLKHRRTVAIKVLRPEFASSIGHERFLREVEIAAGLVHPHIVPLYDSGEADGVLYFVMPHVDGSSLRDVIRAKGPLAVADALAIARGVADGLAYAHAAGFVHRDIKPANILVASGHGLIVDFGVARAAQVAASDSITLTGMVVGTPAFMSPEQLLNEGDLDPRSDIYSLGCVLYSMLAGKAPFEGVTPPALVACLLHGEIPDLTTVNPEVSPEVASLVARMLDRDPADRFQTAAEAASAITQVSTGSGATFAGPRTTGRSVRLGSAAAVLVGAVATALALGVLGRGGAPLTLGGDGESVVILPFHDGASTDEEKALLVDLAGEVTRQLNRWESMRAVPQVALAGISFDLSFSGPTLERVEEGLEIAAQSGVRTLVTLTGRLRGDSAVVVATQFDVASRRSVGRPVESTGQADDRFRIGAGLVHGMLGLKGRVEDVEELRRQSANPEALAQQAEGRRALESWRLQEAESAFRSAIEGDSTFAMAHHYLAITLYWQAARDATRLTSLGPEIARESFAALRHAGGLPAKDSTHAHAFYHFQSGDYELARDAYRTLIARDPTDVFALLLRGIVEFHDPWLTQRPDGSLVPRQSLNVALSSFRETVRLSPGFHLGYGHLFDITSRVLATVDSRAGRGFEMPRDERIAPWDPVTPFDQLSFYPVWEDSLAWLGREDLDARGMEVVREGADRLFRSSMRTLQRWAGYAPTDSRPLDELVQWTLRDRSRLPEPASPERLDSLASVAEEYAERALDTRPDTLATELLRLGNLRLARGDVAGATELVEDAQRLLDADPEAQRQPRASSNLYLFRGQPARAVALLQRESERRLYYPVGDDDELVSDGGADPLVQTLRILGATDVAGAPLGEAFQRLNALWSRPAYTPEQLRTMRSVTAPFIAPALALAPDRAAEWLDGAELGDPIWAVVRADPQEREVGASLLDAASRFEGDRELAGATRAYILGRFAQRIGRLDEAIRHFSYLDSLSHSVQDRDYGWGLLSLSHFRRAQAYQELGDSAAADALYRRFSESWDEADDLAPPLGAQAREALGLSRPSN